MDTAKAREAIEVAAKILAAHGNFVIHLHLPKEQRILGLSNFDNDDYNEFIEDLPYWAEDAERSEKLIKYNLGEKETES